MNRHEELPFKTLGMRLKLLREKSNESMAEVAGAVEIEPEALQKIETGFVRPSEDILMLLINHFDMHEDEATKLWILAGYDRPEVDRSSNTSEDLASKSVVMLMALDTRILYSDDVQVAANKSGVILNFLQPNGLQRNQPMPVARIGMSYDQAHNLLQVLQKTIFDAKYPQPPKGLPAPKSSRKKPNTD